MMNIPATNTPIKMKKLDILLILTIIFVGCVSVPTTKIYRQSDGQISKTIHVFPVADNTANEHVDDEYLATIR